MKNIMYKIFLIILLVGVHAEFQLLNLNISGNSIQISSAEIVIGISILFFICYFLFAEVKVSEVYQERELIWILTFFCVSLLVSTFIAKYKIEAIKYDLRIIVTMILFYLLLSFLFKEKLKIFSINVLIIVGIVASFLGILQFLHIDWVKNFLVHWGHGTWPNAATSFFQHKNVFGNYLVLLLLITTGQLKNSQYRPYRVFLGFIIGLFVLTLGLSLSRSAWVAFLVAASLFIFIKMRSKRVILGAIALTLLFLMAITLHPVPRERIMVQTIHKLWEMKFDEASFGRKKYYQSTALIIKQYPIFGIGLNNFKNRHHEFINAPPNDKINAHNQYLNILAEQGLFGFCIFMIFVAFLVRLAISNIKKGGNEFYALAIFAYLIGALFDYLWYDYIFIFMFWFVVILNIIEKRELEMRDSEIEELET
jgi:O-antigen ligase